MRLANGTSGTFNVSVGMKLPSTWEIEVTKESGTVTVNRESVTWRIGQNVETRAFSPDNHIQREIAVFAQSIKRGKVEPRGTPEEALEDLKIVQAILQSGEEGGVLKSIQ